MATSKSSTNMKPQIDIATVLRRLQNEEVSNFVNKNLSYISASRCGDIQFIEVLCKIECTLCQHVQTVQDVVACKTLPAVRLNFS